ncbi:MAG: T9SS C-terminal target domain-containing protein [Paludibacter sp.]
MKKFFLISLYFLYIPLIVGGLYATDLPSFRVDINKYGRSVAEGNNTNFSPWTFVNNTAVRDTLIHPSFLSDTVIVQLKGLTLANVDTIVWNNYYKAGITSTTVTNDAKLTLDGAFSRIMEMTIHGLPAGLNTLLTYHNNVDAATAWTYNPIRILVDGKVVVDNLMPTVRELNMSNVPVSYLTFNVEAGKDVVIRFEPILVQGSGTLKPFNCVPLNGFEINTPNVLHQAYNPFPSDRNEHADGDTGTITLKWNKAATAVSHNLYIGTDSLTVVNATTASPEYLGNKIKTDTTFSVNTYNMNKYFWRVDEIASNGTITKGNTWYYRVRHLAFKEAEGYGRYAQGGRGGKVVYVTNLNSNGPGSFADAVSQGTGPRTVIFNVSGYIDMPGRIICNPYITIAGQTAPGKGVCLRYAPLGINSESVCRFLRMHLGQTGITYDGMGMAGANNSIMDHCSISWTIDESFSSRGAKNITLQRTMISEALNVAGHDKKPAGAAHGYAGSIGGDVGSFHHNLLAHNEGRNWSMAGGLDGNGYYSGRLDIFNMVVYNWGGRATDGGAHEVNFVNNYYKKGAASTQPIMLKADLEGTGKGSQSYYYSGNVEENTDGSLACDGTDNTCQRSYTLSNGQVLDWTIFVDQPFFPSYAKIETAKNAYKSVMSDVGANMPGYDDHDKRIIKETLTGTYHYKGSVSGKPGLIDNQNDQGGYENYEVANRPVNFDSDMDGLPDWWENLFGTNPNSPSADFSDSNKDADKDGYTELENYLEWMSFPHYYIANKTQSTIVNLDSLSVGYTKSPSYSLEQNANGINITFNAGKATVSASSATAGIYYLNFKVTDSDGSSLIRKVGVCVGASEPTALNEVIQKNNDISIYPSAFEDVVNISINNITSNSVCVKLEDISGKIIQEKQYNLQPGSNNLTYSCSKALAKQVYIIQVIDSKTKEKLANKKIIKK